MGKNKILSKLNINIKDYNNELEKILENKLFSYEAKNLLLSMLYKIENAYKDYETVKVEVPTKREYIENILRIIKEKVFKIFIVKSGSAEAKELEDKNVKFKVDVKNGEIVCFQNEIVILTALLQLEQINTNIITTYNYMEEPMKKMLNQGNLSSQIEVIRDFNGWSWDIVIKEINDITYNFIYQNILLLYGEKIRITNNSFWDIINKKVLQKYLEDNQNQEYSEKFNKIKKDKIGRMQLFENKKEFLDQITQEKKSITKEIEKIDKILNDNELLKKEYYARNEKLPNKEKIFSVSYLVGILNKERTEFLKQINECNSIILPTEFVKQKQYLQKEIEFLSSISNRIKEEDIIEISNEFLNVVLSKIDKITEENKTELIKWIYKIRYYRYIPISNNKYIKDINELESSFENVIKNIIKKAQLFKIWDQFSEDFELSYKILKEVFNSKIIKLEGINIEFKYENKELQVEYYDDTVLENTFKINVDSVKIKKKVKLFV